MFGFLKKKLKEAVEKFTKKAEEEVVEEKVEDTAAIEEAKQEEEALLEAAAEPVEDITAEVAAQNGEAVRPIEEAVPAVAPEVLQPVDVGKTAPVAVKSEETVPEPVVEEKEAIEPGIEEETVPDVGKPVAVEEVAEQEITAEPPQKEDVVEKERTAEEVPVEVSPPELPGGGEEEPAIRETVDEKPVKKGVLSRIFGRKPAQEGVVSRFKEAFTKRTISPEKFDALFWELEVAMLENNVAVEVIEKIKDDLKEALTSGKVSRMGLEDQVKLSLKKSIEDVLSVETFDLLERVKAGKKPFVIAMIGVNGTGKTTTLAKLANLFKTEGLEVVVAASDTFRAAAIDQLKEHADKLGVKLISQGYGADPAAVAFDAIEHAKAKKADVVMIDTAGRLHSNTNLMAELEKVVRVAKPDLKIFIGESITGNDCVEQAKEFDKIAGIDAIILSKADVDEKGGAAISVSYVTKKPILYLGVGQAYGDLRKFDKHVLIKGMGL